MTTIELNLDMASVAIALFIVIVGLSIGRVAERDAHFIYPIDVWSLTIYFSVGIVCIMSIMSIIMQFIIPVVGVIPAVPSVLFLVGYLVGYIISGRKKHINLVTLDREGRHIKGPWVVFYRHTGRWAIAYQHPSEHLKRIVRKDHAYVDGHIDLDKKFSLELGHPYYPSPVYYGLLCNKIDLDKFEWVTTARGGKYRRYKPVIQMAYGSTMSSIEAHYHGEAYDELVIQNTLLANELVREKEMNEVKVMNRVTSIIKSIFNVSPIEQIDKAINEKTVNTGEPVRIERRRMFRRRSNVQ